MSKPDERFDALLEAMLTRPPLTAEDVPEQESDLREGDGE